MELFTYLNYKDYLNAALPTTGLKRGIRARLAKALGCQTGFVSQVLQGNTNFSFEHALKISSFLNHSRQEEKFFMLLVQKGKAGSADLERFFLNQIREILEERQKIKNLIQTDADVTEQDYIRYYSHWYFAAIHILTAVKAFQSKEAISKKLRISSAVVAEALDFLESKQLITQDSPGHYKIGATRIHLDRQSPMIFKHHINWRIEAIRSIEQGDSKNLHYSAVYAMSKADFDKIKELLLKTIEQMEPILAPSSEEEVYTLALDFYKLR